MEPTIISGTTYRFSILTDSLIRMEYHPQGEFTDESTQVVVNRALDQTKVHVIDETNRLEIIGDFFHLYYDKQMFSPAGLYIDVKNNLTPYGNRWRYGDQPANLKGTARTLDESDGAVELDNGILSKEGFAILDDSTSAIVYEEGESIQARSKETVDLYFFAYGRDYKRALRDYYRLTGPTPLLPRYALGNWWSRYWAYRADEYVDLMDRFKAAHIPLSVSVIDMDWHITQVDPKYGSGWTGYTWNNELFPNPEQFLKELKDRQLKVTLNVHPASGIRGFETMYPEVAKRLGLNQSIEEPAVFDMSNPAFRSAYFELVHHPLEQQGVDFWWIDWQQGGIGASDGIDPLWLLNHYHYHDVQRKQQQDIILSRYAGPGSHRYPIGFSGDTFTTWESLQFQPYFTATASNIGYSWWSHDIGGHMHGTHDPELLIRWVQYGVFNPINRLHSSNSPFMNKEPWEQPPMIQEMMQDYLLLRHQLLPYLYTMNVQTHEAGLPLIRPMYYEYPYQEASYHVPNEYYFGSEMIVLPMTHPVDAVTHHAKETVWLPEGIWFDATSGRRYQGNVHLNIYRQLNEIPLFMRAGAIVPMDENALHTPSNELPQKITWHLYPGADNQFTLIEQADKQRIETTLEFNWQRRDIQLKVSQPITERKNKIMIHGIEWDQTMSLEQNMYYDALKNELTIDSIEWSNQIIKLPGMKLVAHQSIDTCVFDFLKQANMPYDLKHEILGKFSNRSNTMSFLASIKNIVSEEVYGILFEWLYVEES